MKANVKPITTKTSIGVANAINDVLEAIGVPRPRYERKKAGEYQSKAEIKEAARVLATVAYNTLSAGISPQDVERWWPR